MDVLNSHINPPAVKSASRATIVGRIPDQLTWSYNGFYVPSAQRNERTNAMSTIPVPDLSAMPLGADPTAGEQIEFFIRNADCIEAYAASTPFRRQRLVVKAIVDGNGLGGMRRDALKFLSQMVGRAQFGGKLNRGSPDIVTTRGRKASRSAAASATVPAPLKDSNGARTVAEHQPTIDMPSRDLLGDTNALLPTSSGPIGANDPGRPEITSYIKDQGFSSSLVSLLLDYRKDIDRHSLCIRLVNLETERRSLTLMPDDIRAALEWIEDAA